MSKRVYAHEIVKFKQYVEEICMWTLLLQRKLTFFLTFTKPWHMS